MGKTIVLNFSGDLDKDGFKVILEAVNPREIRSQGYLPACPNLEDKYQEWQSALQALTKIRNPQSTSTRNVDIFSRIGSIIDSREEAKQHYQDTEKALVQMMNSWLRSEYFMPIREILDNQISHSGKGRLIVRTSNLQLKRLPWESWEWLSSGNRQVTISYSSINFVSPPHVVQKPIRIMAVIGQDVKVDVQKDLDLLQNQLPQNAILEPLIDYSRQQLLECLKKNNCDIFYFAGHSKTSGDRAKIWINKTEYLGVNDLKNTLKQMRLKGLKLAIFNSCDGLGLADELDEENLSVPNLIVMRDAIHDTVAHRFLQELISGFITEKLPLHQAVQKARESLEGLEDRFPGSSLQPVLISGATQDQTYQSWLQKPMVQDRLFKLLINSAIVTLVISAFKGIGWLQTWEWQVYDLMVKVQTSESIENRVLALEIKQEDINYLQGEYPLKNGTLLKVLQKLDEYKPKAIGIDIYRYPPPNKNPQELIEYQNLVKFLQKRDYIVPICFHSDSDLSAKYLPISQNRVGFVDVPLDPDGVIRRTLLAVEPPVQSSCQASYSLSAYLAIAYLQTKGYQIKFPASNVWEIHHPQKQKVVRWQALQPHTSFYSSVQETSGFQMLLNYRHTNSLDKISRRVTLTQILKGEFSANEIRDRIILIGVTDPNLAKDEFETPYNQEIRGLWLHAHMVSQLVSSVEDGRSLLKFLNWELQILVIWLLSVTTLSVTWRFNYLTSLKITGVILALVYTISLGLFMIQGLIIPIIPATLALLIPLLAELISAAISLQRDYSQADAL
jgi:CHASE2 domain-containing sensor protein